MPTLSPRWKRCWPSTPARPIRPGPWSASTSVAKISKPRRGRPGPPRRVASPGRLAQEDAEYVRHGSVNGFVAVAPHQGWRHVLLTERRTARDFAQAVRGLIDEQFPTAERI